MHIKDGLIIKEIDNEYVLIDSGIEPPIFNGLIKLNESGKEIVTLLMKKDMDIDELYHIFNEKYELNEEEFKKVVISFLDELRAVRLING